jgi:molecular chaperone DnaK (HSP70)
MENDIIIGIDLGTTYSCFGIYQNDNVEIISNELGNRTIPSYVGFTEEERYIGENAKKMAGQNPLNTVYDAKRLIGRKYSDETIQKDLKHYTFKITPDSNDLPLINVEYLNETKTFYPEQISAMILEKIKNLAEKYLNKPVTKAVITVPAYFNDSQRKSTSDAGKIAGLEVVRIINEPTAAALAYGLNEKNTKNILVYDLGGGTFDVTVLTVDNGVFEVKSTSGNTHLGGEDFDIKLKEYILYSYAEKNILKTKNLTDSDKLELINLFNLSNLSSQTDFNNSNNSNNLNDYINKLKLYDSVNINFESILNNNVKKYLENLDKFYKLKKNMKSMRKLQTCCEDAKKTLSQSNIANIMIENFYDSNDLKMSVTKNIFEEICKELFEKTLDSVKSALIDAKFSERDIDDVVLIGGSTRIPAIRDILEKKFPSKVRSNINPDEAVAYGATIQAALLSGKQFKSGEITLLDVTPLSLGIETAGGVMAKMIKRNQSIPCSVEEVFSTFTDNQPAVTVKVFEGERELTKDCNHLGTFELTNLPPLPKGLPRIKVTFMVDANGMMSVKAIEESTGKENKIIIENKKDRLQKEQIQNMINDANKYAEIDKMVKDRIEARNSLDHYIQSIKRTIENPEYKLKLGESIYKEIYSKLFEYDEWMENAEDMNVSANIYNEKYKLLENYVLPLIKNVL